MYMSYSLRPSYSLSRCTISSPVLAAPFEHIIFQAASCCTTHTQEWQAWLDNQPASLHNKADEILRRDNQAKSAVAATRYQGRGFTFQHEDDAVGAQGTIREDSGDGPG